GGASVADVSFFWVRVVERDGFVDSAIAERVAVVVRLVAGGGGFAGCVPRVSRVDAGYFGAASGEGDGDRGDRSMGVCAAGAEVCRPDRGQDREFRCGTGDRRLFATDCFCGVGVLLESTAGMSWSRRKFSVGTVAAG